MYEAAIRPPPQPLWRWTKFLARLCFYIVAPVLYLIIHERGGGRCSSASCRGRRPSRHSLGLGCKGSLCTIWVVGAAHARRLGTLDEGDHCVSLLGHDLRPSWYGTAAHAHDVAVAGTRIGTSCCRVR